MIANIFYVLPVLGAVAIMVLAQTQVRERSSQAALALTIGGGLEPGYVLVRHFFQNQLLWLAGPLVSVGSAGAVCFGLLTLVDELNPKRDQPLPPLLSNHNPTAPNAVPQVMFGVFGVLGILGTGLRFSMPLSASAILAIGGPWRARCG